MVPDCITEITVAVLGASGGGGLDETGATVTTGDQGGQTSDVLTVTPGETLTVQVGAQGSNGGNVGNGSVTISYQSV